MDMPEDAVIQYKKILSIIPDSQSESIRLFQLDTIASLVESLLKLQEAVEAHRWAQKHFHLVDKSTPNAECVRSYRMVGMTLMHLQDLSAAYKNFNEMEKMSLQVGDPELQEEVDHVLKTLSQSAAQRAFGKNKQ